MRADLRQMGTVRPMLPLLSPDLVESFGRDGAVVLRGVFSDWIETLAAGVATNEADPGPMPGLDEDLTESVVIIPEGGTDAYFALSSNGARKVCLRPAAAEADCVFGDAAQWVRSEALVRLDFGGGRKGMLVFGAEDPHRFAPEHGVDLLTFFGGVVERSLRRWLAPEA